jgi:hypothetical protein
LHQWRHLRQRHAQLQLRHPRQQPDRVCHQPHGAAAAAIRCGWPTAPATAPAGTTIQFSASNGTILGAASATVQNTSAADSSAWYHLGGDQRCGPRQRAQLHQQHHQRRALTVTGHAQRHRDRGVSFPVTD